MNIVCASFRYTSKGTNCAFHHVTFQLKSFFAQNFDLILLTITCSKSPIKKIQSRDVALTPLFCFGLQSFVKFTLHLTYSYNSGQTFQQPTSTYLYFAYNDFTKMTSPYYRAVKLVSTVTSLIRTHDNH